MKINRVFLINTVNIGGFLIGLAVKVFEVVEF